jgi:predicted DNA-binding transcriptional regulator YafY
VDRIAELILLDQAFEVPADFDIHEYVVTFSAADLEWPARVALGYGPHAIVLEPEELRHLVGERARAIAAQYASAG